MTREVAETYTACPTSEIVFYHNPLVALPPVEFASSPDTRETLRRAYHAIDHGDLQLFLRLHEELGMTPRRSRLEEFAAAALLTGDIDVALQTYDVLCMKPAEEELLAAAGRAAASGHPDAVARARAYLKT